MTDTTTPAATAEAGGISGAVLRSYIERIEKLEEEKAGIAADIRELTAAIDAIHPDGRPVYGSPHIAADPRWARLITAVQAARTAQEEADVIPLPSSTFDLIAHLRRQIDFSRRTFGPGRRTEGVTAHITKELDEIRSSPDELGEWVDVILLALDGAWRTGATPDAIADAIERRQTRNEARTWPDWRSQPEDGPIEHIRGREEAPEPAPTEEDPDYWWLEGYQDEGTTDDPVTELWYHRQSVPEGEIRKAWGCKEVTVKTIYMAHIEGEVIKADTHEEALSMVAAAMRTSDTRGA